MALDPPTGLVQDNTAGAPTTVDVVFNLAAVGLPRREANHMVQNLVPLLASQAPLALSATFGPQGASMVSLPFYDRPIQLYPAHLSPVVNIVLI